VKRNRKKEAGLKEQVPNPFCDSDSSQEWQTTSFDSFDELDIDMRSRFPD
jgi:hypothetical protein